MKARGTFSVRQEPIPPGCCHEGVPAFDGDVEVEVDLERLARWYARTAAFKRRNRVLALSCGVTVRVLSQRPVEVPA